VSSFSKATVITETARPTRPCEAVGMVREQRNADHDAGGSA